MKKKLGNEEIKIQRNPVENFLMALQKFFKHHRKLVIWTVAAIFIVLIAYVVYSVVYDQKSLSDQAKFDKSLESVLSINTQDEAARKIKIEEGIKELDSIVSKSWGPVAQIGYYNIAFLCNEYNRADLAKVYFVKFADKNKKSLLAPLAIKQAAVVYEDAGDFQNALNLYQRLAKDYSESIIKDRIDYDLGRMYQRIGDMDNAKKSFNKVILEHPGTEFAKDAQKRIQLKDNEWTKLAK